MFYNLSPAARKSTNTTTCTTYQYDDIVSLARSTTSACCVDCCTCVIVLVDLLISCINLCYCKLCIEVYSSSRRLDMSIELGYIYSRGYIFGMEVMHQIYNRGACDIIDHIRVSPMRLHILQNHVSFYISVVQTQTSPYMVSLFWCIRL